MTDAGEPCGTYRGERIDLVIDVRSRLEFWLGHLDGAVCIPVSSIASRMAAHPAASRDVRVLVYCASGARSAAAASQLRAMGFRRVTDAGGIGEASRHYVAGR